MTSLTINLQAVLEELDKHFQQKTLELAEQMLLSLPLTEFNFAAWEALARYYALEKNFKGAYRATEFVLTHFSDQAERWEHAIYMYFDGMNFEKAIECYNQILKMGGKTDRLDILWIRIATHYHKNNDFEKTCGALAVLCAHFPNSIEGWNLAATLYWNMQQNNKAVECFEHLLKINTTVGQQIDTYYHWGVFYLQNNQPQKALDCFKNALSYDPQNLSILDAVEKTVFALNSSGKLH